MYAIKLEAEGHRDINSAWSKALRLSKNIYLHAKPGMRIHCWICHLRKVVWLHNSLLELFCFYSYYILFCNFYVFITFYACTHHSFDISLRRIGKVLAYIFVLHLTQWNDSINLAWRLPWHFLLHMVKGYPWPEFLNTWQETVVSICCLFIIMQIEPFPVLLI